MEFYKTLSNDSIEREKEDMYMHNTYIKHVCVYCTRMVYKGVNIDMVLNHSLREINYDFKLFKQTNYEENIEMTYSLMCGITCVLIRLFYF